MPEELRTKRVEVVMTPTEYAEIAAAAKSEGMQLAAFVRYAAIRMARTRTQ
jgi:uncharacterized protein (DUF1778 family)